MDSSSGNNAAAASAKPMVQRSQDDMVRDHDFDELVDEDWLDMENPPQTLPLLSNTSLADPAKDDHQVPSVPLFNTQQVAAGDVAAVDSSAGARTAKAATEPVVPFALTVSTEDVRSLEQQGLEQTPTSSSPSSSSDSEFSLLNPSTEQSRKNSISSVAGFHPLTPTGSRTQGASPTTSEGHSSQEQDYQHAATITSPSFSDFVQVGSDHGDDFSGIDSGSARSSSAQTPASASSDEKDRLDDEEECSISADPLDKTDRSDVAAESRSGQEPSLKSHYSTIGATLFSPPVSTLDHDAPSPAAEPLASPASTASTSKRAVYRTTVEDATGSSEDERQQAPSGIRHRSAHTANADRDDIRRSFYGASSATSTMPGAFNLGLDAELHARTKPAAANAAPVHDPPMDERQCRICLGGADEEDTLGRLISPCLCKGSMKYVHVEW